MGDFDDKPNKYGCLGILVCWCIRILVYSLLRRSMGATNSSASRGKSWLGSASSWMIWMGL